MKRGILSIAVALVLVSVLGIFLVAFQVRETEHAIVYTFDREARTIKEPGLYWKLPYPIQTVQKFDTRMHVTRVATSREPALKHDQTSTRDQMSIVLSVATGWSIDDPGTFRSRDLSVATAETLPAASRYST